MSSRVRVPGVLLGTFLLLGSACRDVTPPVATGITLSVSTVSLDALGASQPVSAAVVDQHGKPMMSEPVTWGTSGAAATVAPAGPQSAVVTAAANGTVTLTATAGAATAQIPVHIIQVPVSIQKVDGDKQEGTAGTPLPAPLRVQVRDRLGAGVNGQVVSFSVVMGGGELPGGGTASANTQGVAAIGWTLGRLAGATQEVVATVPGVGEVARFSATAHPGAPAKLEIYAGNGQSAAAGAMLPVPPTVRVADSFDNGIPGVQVTFEVTGGGGSIGSSAAVTGPLGTASAGSWRLGGATGPNSVTARAAGLAPAVFQATALSPGEQPRIFISAGDNQAAMAGSAVPIAPAVLVRDGLGNPVAGAQVDFSVVAGGGRVTGASATTDGSGIARVGSWVLGDLAAPNTLRARLAGQSASIDVVAVGCSGGGGSGFAITLCYTTSISMEDRSEFERAAMRWSRVITGDLPSVPLEAAAGTCGSRSPRVNMMVDDVVILVTVEEIDGPGFVLGSAGPCYIRTGQPGTPGRSLPVLGRMRLDVADLSQLRTRGLLTDVILHEMGHVIGIGTLWNTFGLLQLPSSASQQQDTHFSGVNGRAGFDQIGGNAYTGGNKVPVENTGGSGTMNGHWREGVLGNELMTGFINSGQNPLSALTVRSLEDLGYTVDRSAADSFSLGMSAVAADTHGHPPVRLVDDIYVGPLYEVDPQGRQRRIR